MERVVRFNSLVFKRFSKSFIRWLSADGCTPSDCAARLKLPSLTTWVKA